MGVADIILQSFWFLVPAYFANMIPVGVSRLKFLDVPVDFGKKFMGKPVFGRNKTYRGFFFGILIAIALAYLQGILYARVGYFRQISLLDYSRTNLLLLGFLMGFGALFGDLVKSFFKRRVGVPPGKSWIPFDQSDYILGTLAFVALIYIPPIENLLVMLAMSVILHFAVVYIGYHLGIRKSKV